MKYFKLGPAYDKTGRLYSKWVDDSLFLSNFAVNREHSLIDRWPNDLKFSISDEGLLCDVLFNPDAPFFSQKVRDAIEPQLINTVEWLPVQIENVGQYYILHPLRFVELGSNSIAPQNSVSKNYTHVEKYDFTPSVLPVCFMVRQAVGSAARRGSYCIREMIFNEMLNLKFRDFVGVSSTFIYES